MGSEMCIRDSLCAMGYAAQRCQPVDMFCQTAGVENVMLFERQQAAEQP